MWTAGSRELYASWSIAVNTGGGLGSHTAADRATIRPCG